MGMTFKNSNFMGVVISDESVKDPILKDFFESKGAIVSIDDDGTFHLEGGFTLFGNLKEQIEQFAEARGKKWDYTLNLGTTSPVDDCGTDNFDTDNSDNYDVNGPTVKLPLDAWSNYRERVPRENNSMERLIALIKKYNATDKDHALRRASRLGKTSDVITLVNLFGADIRSTSTNGNTPLDWAKKDNHTEVIEFLTSIFNNDSGYEAEALSQINPNRNG